MKRLPLVASAVACFAMARACKTFDDYTSPRGAMAGEGGEGGAGASSGGSGGGGADGKGGTRSTGGADDGGTAGRGAEAGSDFGGQGGALGGTSGMEGGDSGAGGAAGSEMGGDSGSGGDRGMGVGTFKWFSDATAMPPSSRPRGITVGPDGNIWFTMVNVDRIGRLTPAGVMDFWPIAPRGSLGSSPTSIVTGPDENLWFTEYDSSRIGCITEEGVITHRDLTPGSTPRTIAVGSDGNLWFTEYDVSKIGRLVPNCGNPALGALDEWPTPTNPSGPFAIAAGPDGRIWFTETTTDKIGAITPGVSPTFAEYSLTAGSDPSGITAGPGGTLWVSERRRHRIARLTVNGACNAPCEFWLGRTPGPFGITPHVDGNVYAADYDGDTILRVTPAGEVAVYPIDANLVDPYNIVSGPDGALWFTCQATSVIGRLEPE